MATRIDILSCSADPEEQELEDNERVAPRGAPRGNPLPDYATETNVSMYTSYPRNKLECVETNSYRFYPT